MARDQVRFDPVSGQAYRPAPAAPGRETVLPGLTGPSTGDSAGDSFHQVNGPASIGRAVRAVVMAALTFLRRAGTVSLKGLTDAVDTPFRVLTRRVAADAVVQPRPVPDTPSLAAALAARPNAPVLGGATAVAMAARVARRFGPLRFLARRTPMWLVAVAGPALHASLAKGADELALVASHLVHRARDSGIEPDPERVRRVAMQLVSGAPVDPGTDNGHQRLIAAWLQRALRSALPLTAGVATRDPQGLARAAATVPPAALGQVVNTTAH
jgi:hypothetical protein